MVFTEPTGQSSAAIGSIGAVAVAVDNLPRVFAIIFHLIMSQILEIFQSASPFEIFSQNKGESV